MTIKDLKHGESAVITDLDENLYGIERLKELGFIKGTTVTVVRFSPFNDPVIIKIRGYEVCIRLSDAGHIKVKRV